MRAIPDALARAFAVHAQAAPDDNNHAIEQHHDGVCGFTERKETMLTNKCAWRKNRLPWKSRMVAGTCLTFLMAATAYGQDQEKSNAIAPAHPVHTAPKKAYTPASVHALPGLQCQLYPTGSEPSTGLEVYTNDDGYARFHAVRAAAGDGVQQLTMDCTDSAGQFSTYIVDLTSDDTFTPRPLNLANERGVDRPALQGDPLSYTQSELIQAGYGLRPDPKKDAAAYSRWLAAASIAGRMLEAKRPTSQHSHTVYTTPGGPWTGTVLTGAPNYIATIASFNVPTAIPGGDETSGTEIAIWNGLGGYGPSWGLIQGGVGIITTPSTATYHSWREYCCGNPHSNNYTGNFVPNPKDQVSSAEWYCDSMGNPNLNGGYGCTFLEDETTGAIFNCTLAKGSPCWSVPALPLCSTVSPPTPCAPDNTGWVVGQSAEFVIENESPQLNPPSTAFTDFTPLVTMVGDALSSQTGSYSQTVVSDPVVTLLTDFTNTTSHMSVWLGSSNVTTGIIPEAATYFNVSQWAPVPGAALSWPTSVPCPPVPYGCYPQSIAVGPNILTSLFNASPIGDAWILGSDHTAGGDYYVYHWQNSNSEWLQIPGAAATEIAVSPQGYPWVVNHLGQIYYWNGSQFIQAPGCATSIGVGPNAYGSQYGSPWIIGCDGWGPNGNIYQLQGSKWVQQPGKATQIAVSPEGVPWVINAAGNVYHWNSSDFVGPVGACATSIAVGPVTAPLAGPYGDAWVTGCGSGSGGYNIWQFQKGISWVQIPGTATQISVSPDLGVPWIVNSFGQIYK
jgi:hypothetical protein